MATKTTNYGWTKPDYEDDADIAVLNETFDAIDEQVKTVETALENKQSTLSTTQLAAVNSGIDSTKVAQIETNKNNILLTADQSTQYNYMDFNSYGTGNSGTIDSINTTTNTITVSGTAAWAKGIIYLNNVPSGTYRLKYTVSSNSSAGASITMNEGSTQKTSKVWNNSTGDYTSGEITFGDNAKSLYVTANNSASSLSNSVSITITNVMLIPKSLYDAGFTDYQPYAMSNAELTANILPSSYNAVEVETGAPISILSGGYARIGNLVCVNLKISVTGTISQADPLVKGLPKPILEYNTGYGAVSLTNNIGRIFNVIGVGSIAYGDSTSISSGTVILSGMYIAQ